MNRDTDPSIAPPEVAPPEVAPELVATLVTWWRGLVPGATGCRVLAIEGRSGSGKTTLAAALAAAAPDAVLVAMDETYPGWDGLDDGTRLVLATLLEPLATGRPAGVRRWDWDAGEPGTLRPVAPGPLLLLEGIGCGATTCAPHLGGLVWVDAPDDLRRRRALARDGDTYAPHWSRWAAQEEAYLRRERPRERADLIVDGGENPMSTARPGR